ncbi:MAG: phage baseplate assembly protein V [Actinomycetota bacterium]
MLDSAVAPDLVQLIQAIVRQETAHIRTAEVGLVTTLHSHASGDDKNNYECDVKLRDSGLELQKVPVATGRVGLAAIPNVDDLVLVTFVGGDLHGAVIVGRLYNDVDRPPEAKAKELVYVSPDAKESGVRRVYLEFPNGNKLCLDDDKLTIEAKDTTITLKNSGDVELSSNAKLLIKTKGDAELKSDGNVKIEAGGSLSLKAATDVKVEGLSISLKSQTTTQVEGGASTAVKGPMISIAGMTSFSPS